MSDTEEQKFEETVAGYLAKGLHSRRGLTVEEYTAVCRKAWNACHASPGFPFKILIDPLQSIQSMLANSTQEYIHYRVADELEAEKDPSLEIRCVALGAVKPDLSTGPDDSPPLATEEPDAPETRRYLLAVFDVLGFSARLQEKGLNEITILYARLIDEAVTKEAMRAYTIVRFSENQNGSVIGVLPVRHAHFSDTILLWVPLVQHFIAPFIARCADMVCEALRMGLPLRGALAAGPAVLHSRTGTFIGTPLVEAARLEQAQDWLGVSLGASMLAADISREFDPNLILPYAVPFKKGKSQVSADLALDWPSRFRARFGTDPIEAVRVVNTSPLHRVYYDNAVKFAEFSAGPVFRSDGLNPPELGELADAAVSARRTKTPLSRHYQFILKDLSRTGIVGDSVAKFVEAVAEGHNLADIPDGLPPGLHRYLQELLLAAGGTAKFFKLVPCVVEAVCMRICGTPLTQEVDAMLTDLEQYGQDGKQVSKFLRDLAAGGAPTVPRKLSKTTGPFLKQALAWVNDDRVPPGLVRHVAEDCLKARLGYAALDEDALRALAAMEATKGNWPKVADFLRAVATGDDPPVPKDIAEPIRSDLFRLSLGSRLAGVQPPRTLEIMSVGFGDPATNIDLYSLIHGLRMIEAVAEGRPIPLDPSLVGLAAIRARHGGGPMGDCIMYSLQTMARAGPEAKTLANYLWSIAHRGPAGPAPVLKEPQLAAIAEEIRCLADTEVGGIRMMFAQAKQSLQTQAPLECE